MRVGYGLIGLLAVACDGGRVNAPPQRPVVAVLETTPAIEEVPSPPAKEACEWTSRIEPSTDLVLLGPDDEALAHVTGDLDPIPESAVEVTLGPEQHVPNVRIQNNGWTIRGHGGVLSRRGPNSWSLLPARRLLMGELFVPRPHARLQLDRDATGSLRAMLGPLHRITPIAVTAPVECADLAVAEQAFTGFEAPPDARHVTLAMGIVDSKDNTASATIAPRDDRLTTVVFEPDNVRTRVAVELADAWLLGWMQDLSVGELEGLEISNVANYGLIGLLGSGSTKAKTYRCTQKLTLYAREDDKDHALGVLAANHDFEAVVEPQGPVVVVSFEGRAMRWLRPARDVSFVVPASELTSCATVPNP